MFLNCVNNIRKYKSSVLKIFKSWIFIYMCCYKKKERLSTFSTVIASHFIFSHSHSYSSQAENKQKIIFLQIFYRVFVYTVCIFFFFFWCCYVTHLLPSMPIHCHHYSTVCRNCYVDTSFFFFSRILNPSNKIGLR